MRRYILRKCALCLVALLAGMVFSSPGSAVTETREIAAKMVSSPKFPEHEARAGKSRITNLAILMRIPAEVLDGIERYGFLNQHQTLSTRGAFTPEKRRKAEKSFLQGLFDLEKYPNSLRPKSGYLYFEAKNIRKTTIALDQYGEIIFRFKPEVLRRTTYTIGDSLLTSRLGSPPVSNLAHLQREMSLTGNRRYIEFFEALIWGDLNLGDVETVFVAEDANRRLYARVKALAVRNGIGFGTYRYDVPPYTGELLKAHKQQLKMIEQFPEIYKLKVYFDAAKGGRSTPEVFTVIKEPKKTVAFGPPSSAWLNQRLKAGVSLSEQFIIYQHLLEHDRKAAQSLKLQLKEQIRQIPFAPDDEFIRQYLYNVVEGAANYLIR